MQNVLNTFFEKMVQKQLLPWLTRRKGGIGAVEKEVYGNSENKAEGTFVQNVLNTFFERMVQKQLFPWLNRRRGGLERPKRNCMIIRKIIKSETSALLSCL